MFLFDKYKTSQQRYTTGNKAVSLRWKTFLNSSPPYAAESTAVTDQFENLYFGSHNGIFYSLSKIGKIRWSFYTKKKIYSSPILYKRKVVFIGGDGFVYCLNTDSGEVIWKKDLKIGYYETFKQKLFQEMIHLPYTLNLKRKMLMNTKSWSSPMLIGKTIIATGFGRGLYAYDIETGNELWSYNLYYPRYQLCGIVTDEEDNIYCISRNGKLYSFNKTGEILSEKRVLNFHSSWGNPSYNPTLKHLYLVFSRGERIGIILAINKSGEVHWKVKLDAAIHGSVAIGKNNKDLYCCDFKGFIYKINAHTGEIKKKVKVSETNRALWTTPTIDFNSHVYISTKNSNSTGYVIKFDSDLKQIWSFKVGKTLSVPLLMPNGDVCFGSWDGYYYRLKTK